jgi:hypothetical protein
MRKAVGPGGCVVYLDLEQYLDDNYRQLVESDMQIGLPLHARNEKTKWEELKAPDGSVQFRGSISWKMGWQ